MIAIIDNYDSFTFNLVQYLREFGQDVHTFRNDKVTVAELQKLPISHLVVSPGPCTPDQAGISMEAIRAFAGKVPILGVCLGHQSIGQAFGGVVVKASRLMHGKTSVISHNGTGIFAGITNPFTAIRYHSLVVDKKSVPGCLDVVATSDDGEIMAVQHKEHVIIGLQFHPESVLTENGKRLLKNFVNMNERVLV